MKSKGNIENASARPWRVEYVTKQKAAYVKGADNAVVAICHADNAEMIVAAVNEIGEAERLRDALRDLCEWLAEGIEARGQINPYWDNAMEALKRGGR